MSVLKILFALLLIFINGSFLLSILIFGGFEHFLTNFFAIFYLIGFIVGTASLFLKPSILLISVQLILVAFPVFQYFGAIVLSMLS